MTSKMAKGPYEQLQATEDVHDDSSSDVTIPFMDDEDPMQWKEGYDEPPRSRRTGFLPSIERLKPLRWLVEIALVIAVVVLLVQRRQPIYDSQKPELAGDITGFAPRFSQKIVTFEFNDEYIPTHTARFFRAKTHRKWLDLVPKGLGFLEMQNPEEYDNLPVPLDDFVNKTVFTTSMTHQLHCLHSIIDSYSRLALNWRVKHNEWHVQHCFEYLRQSIMCCGDVALEGQETTFPEGERGGSDGWGAQHVCKDYDEIYEYLEAARANDEVWI